MKRRRGFSKREDVDGCQREKKREREESAIILVSITLTAVVVWSVVVHSDMMS